MPSNKLIELEELRAPGTRRVFESVRMLGQEFSDFEDDSLPEMPPGVLMKSRQDGGGWQRE
jgi:hypothetical protein